MTNQDSSSGRKLRCGAVGVGLFLGSQLVRLLARPLPAAPELPEGFGGYRVLGVALYTDYVLLVETASLLLLAAIVGALILAKRRID